MESEKTMTAKVSSKGWVVIPAVLRKRFGLKPGTIVELQEVGERIVIIPGTQNPVDNLYGKLAGKTSLTKELLDERREELRRENDKIRI